MAHLYVYKVGDDFFSFLYCYLKTGRCLFLSFYSPSMMMMMMMFFFTYIITMSTTANTFAFDILTFFSLALPFHIIYEKKIFFYSKKSTESPNREMMFLCVCVCSTFDGGHIWHVFIYVLIK